MGISCDHGLHGDLRYWPVPELVALDLPGGIGFVDALRAVWDTGDAAAPLDPRLPPVARRMLLDALRPTRIVGSDGEQHASGRGHRPSRTATHWSWRRRARRVSPRGVVLTHDAVAASAAATSARLGVDPARHVWLACLPLAHIGGLAVVTRSIVTGTPVVVLPGFEAEVVEEAGRSGRVSHVSLVATALQRLDPSVFTCVLLGGSRVPDALPPNVVATYGMTETGSGVIYDGWPLEGVEVAFRPSPEPTGGGAGARRGAATARGGDPDPGPHVAPLLPRRRRRAGRGAGRRAGLVRHRRCRTARRRRKARRVRPHGATSSRPARRRSGPIRSSAS